MCLFRKPPLHEVHAFLRRHNALIVHFSGAPGAGSTPIRYPADLQNVIAGRAMSGLSCSVVMPHDLFTGTGERNAYGTIGVILDLQHDQSLATATRGDGGSHWNGQGHRQFDERDLTTDDLERSITGRTGHNEWGIRNYIVRGVFVIHPIEIWGVVHQSADGDIEDVMPICNHAEHPRRHWAAGKLLF